LTYKVEIEIKVLFLLLIDNLVIIRSFANGYSTRRLQLNRLCLGLPHLGSIGENESRAFLFCFTSLPKPGKFGFAPYARNLASFTPARVRSLIIRRPIICHMARPVGVYALLSAK
jgi:hypothetical protein